MEMMQPAGEVFTGLSCDFASYCDQYCVLLCSGSFSVGGCAGNKKGVVHQQPNALLRIPSPILFWLLLSLVLNYLCFLVQMVRTVPC